MTTDGAVEMPERERLARASFARTRILTTEAALQIALQERDHVVQGLVLAAIAGEHVCLLGPAGTAKSLLTRSFADASGIAGDAYFEWLLSRFTAPEELFGPISLKAMTEQDRFTRVSAGKLPTAKLAFLDEVFKGSSAILNALLAALNERVFHDDGVAKPMPLRMVVGASNELPEGPELAALWDRFLMRYDVKPLFSRDSFVTMLMKGVPKIDARASESDWQLAHESAARVEFPESVADALFKIRKDLAGVGVTPSDRRFVKCVSILRARAWLDGDASVSTEHLGVLAPALWEEPEQLEEVQKVLAKYAVAEIEKSKRVFDAIVQQLDALPAEPTRDDLTQIARLRAEAGRAEKTLQEHQANAPTPKAKEQIEKLRAALVVKRDAIVAKGKAIWEAS